MVTRRYFITSSGVALASLGAMTQSPSFLARALAQTNGQRGGRKKVLVAIFQRGAADGLNVVVPYGEQAYYDMRPTIAVARPKNGEQGGVIELDGFFGLNPVSVHLPLLMRATWRSSMPQARPITPAHTLMRRTIWSPARPA